MKGKLITFLIVGLIIGLVIIFDPFNPCIYKYGNEKNVCLAQLAQKRAERKARWEAKQTTQEATPGATGR
jgi:hypothetical protein